MGPACQELHEGEGALDPKGSAIHFACVKRMLGVYNVPPGKAGVGVEARMSEDLTAWFEEDKKKLVDMPTL